MEVIKKFLENPRARIIAALLGLYLLSTGVSAAAFSYLKTTPEFKLVSPSGLFEQRAGIDPNAPRDQECPLNGKMFTKGERDIWASRRPLGVMLENHEEARPQSGLSRADIVYEAVAEGGITRFLAIYYCAASAEEVQLGPVRSARTYYLDWISEYGDASLYAHVGGANKPGPANALGQITQYGWNGYNDLNQFSIGFPTFWRDYERLGRPVATEHTMYSTTDKLWEAANKRGLSDKNEEGQSWDKNFVPWNFKDGSPSPTVEKISFPFFEGYKEYEVTWKYDAASNSYMRENGGQPNTDLNNGEQLVASNIVIMFTGLRGPIDELKHLLYTTTGRGEALVFQNGQALEATWSKPSRTARTKFTSKTGAEISFVRGPIWIEVLGIGTKVSY